MTIKNTGLFSEDWTCPWLLDEYQEKAHNTAIYPKDMALPYLALGLTGEAGEVAEKMKKNIRDGKLDHHAVALELGDVLWYIANLAFELDYTLQEIAEMNVTKLNSRFSRSVIKGEGDFR